MSIYGMIAKKNMKNNEFNKFAEIAMQSDTLNNFLKNLYNTDISIAEVEYFLRKNEFEDLEEFYRLITDRR